MQFLEPVVPMAFGSRRGKKPVLPGSKVAVVDSRRGQSMPPALDPGLVQLQNFLLQNLKRPCVAYDVMLVDEKDVIAAAEPEKKHPRERTALKIEGLSNSD